MDLLKVCQVCKRNITSQSCKFCGKLVCLNCSKKGFCNSCYPKS